MTSTRHFDAIVIGGGTMGTAAAWALARRGMRTLVLEQFQHVHDQGSHGGETRIILEFQDDHLQVFYLLDIVNSARTPIDPGGPLVIDLPADAAGAATMQGSSSLASLKGHRLQINGPFPPGTTQVQAGFRLPYSGDRVSLTQRWPATLRLTSRRKRTQVASRKSPWRITKAGSWRTPN